MENLLIQEKIIKIRNQKVILDTDIATLYGVATRDINKSVKNNPDKFPEGYVFDLSVNEKEEVVEIFHHLQKIKYSPQAPKAFTEKGLYMLATILRSPLATATTISIIETFSKLKSLQQNIQRLSNTKEGHQKQNLLQKSGEIISEILDNDLAENESETSIELNFAVLKFKHTIKKKKEK